MASRGANEMLEKVGKIEEEKKFSRQTYFPSFPTFSIYFSRVGKKSNFDLCLKQPFGSPFSSRFASSLTCV